MDLCNQDAGVPDGKHHGENSKTGLIPGNMMPIAPIPNITEILEQCKKPLCDDADMECIIDLINATLCEAVAIIESDPRGLFCYKFPLKHLNAFGTSSAFDSVVLADAASNQQAQEVYTSADSGSSCLTRNILTIGNFDYNNAISDVRDFISRWELSPDTKCVVISNSSRHQVPIKGTIHFIDAHFSRPTPRCPNPLAVAKVRFIITVSKLLLKNYPVMITYRFEGYNTLYYAVGERSFRSFTFQRFYIDTILHTKLSFFAAIAECRHGTVDNPKHNVKAKKPKTRHSDE